ncbi:conserved protein of unknown function [Magnetospirillum sp. XM-1]|uniref:methyltransferase, TIGR04325 family n=1 Tax=Magnetospirillum sp. XM-1 TaxID=1663591 RepID=UPI00073DBD26|nr:methyltransferase, TIGR04325 family [Magnetospirillum sp. XM-1]CUW37983.1 conserved protein of unknown function [Magnetospirillum sp. XM-1]
MSEFFIWEGVYDHYDDVEKSGGGFDTDFWRDRNRARIVAELDTLRNSGQLPESAKCRDYVLPVVIAMAAAGRERFRILDFGGGLGNGFVPALCDVVSPERLDYVIVDNDRLCDAGRYLFPEAPAPIFRPDLPPDQERFDLLHLGSVLPYISDWRGLLTRLCGYRPRHVLLSDLLAGDFPAFATAQNCFGDKIPHWFLNLGDVIGQVESQGFRLIFKAPFVGTFLGKQGPLPMDNFPPEYRLQHACHLLFEKL